VEVVIDKDTAYLEIAQTAGLQQIKHSSDIFEVWSYPVGQALKHCIYEYKVKKLVMGIGGSSFSDTGIGLMTALMDWPRLKRIDEILKV